ncbi:MAG: ATP-binding protein [Desulfobacterales bacterium]|nr:ATP-binding protein [Desulfobacterales bacterium]
MAKSAHRSPQPIDGFVEPLSAKSYAGYRRLFDRIMASAAEGRMTLEVLKEAAGTLLRFFECEAAEVVYQEKQKIFHAKCVNSDRPACSGWKEKSAPSASCIEAVESAPRELVERLQPLFLSAPQGAAERRLVYLYDAARKELAPSRRGPAQHAFLLIPDGNLHCGSIVLSFSSERRADENSHIFLTRLAVIIGLSLRHNRSRFELRERVKELTCMHSIANLAMDSAQPVEVFLERVVELLPPGYLNPDITEARVRFDGHDFQTRGFTPTPYRQSASIAIDGVVRGAVEVVYREPRPELDEGPFLAEERRLLDSVAREIALIIERKQAESEKARLQEQLQHADRLATIGKLAAGVAHELNEPLTGILGFAELLKEIPGMPAQAEADIARVEAAALHAREVVRKLLLFARQISPRQDPVNVNRLAREVASFFEARCAQHRIEVRLDLDPTLPDIPGDEPQVRQILVNLVVNAIHAMEQGGRLRVSTRLRGADILLSVKDSGSGIPDDIKEKIFLPFFTTKDVDQGTGLGLSVVHGIVKSHRGRIKFSSRAARGTHFKVYLPAGVTRGAAAH